MQMLGLSCIMIVAWIQFDDLKRAKKMVALSSQIYVQPPSASETYCSDAASSSFQILERLNQ